MGAYNKEGRTAVDIAGSRNHLVVECYLRGEGADSSAEFWDAAEGGRNPGFGTSQLSQTSRGWHVPDAWHHRFVMSEINPPYDAHPLEQNRT